MCWNNEKRHTNCWGNKNRCSITTTVPIKAFKGVYTTLTISYNIWKMLDVKYFGEVFMSLSKWCLPSKFFKVLFQMFCLYKKRRFLLLTEQKYHCELLDESLAFTSTLSLPVRPSRQGILSNCWMRWSNP